METIISRHKTGDICARIFERNGHIAKRFEFDKTIPLNHIIDHIERINPFSKGYITVVPSFGLTF